MLQLLGPANMETTPQGTPAAAAVRRHSTRREERVTVQGPVKKLQPDEVSPKGGVVLGARWVREVGREECNGTSFWVLATQDELNGHIGKCEPLMTSNTYLVGGMTDCSDASE